ncbi:MAG: 50S ribosomal protein L23 [Prevotellaceae bacterium]|jgi:large subunit ribosomal protein L23|nr:50S ribosomal protein L23 [Prevotellaceae bacterium]
MSIIIKPVVTEKMTQIGEKFNRVAFRVVRDANKIEIKKAVEALYNVSVVKVNTSIVKGKHKSRYTQTRIVKGTTPFYKKAIITLKEGDNIDFYSNI